MSKVWSSPVGVGYPVDFRSGGDTTRDAFGKHIQEIERIYGMLNALDAGKVGASDVSGSIGSVNSSLTAHINSSNPHPNWKPSLSGLSGKLDASRISGLTSLIDGRIPASGGDGITSGSLGDNGYVKFKNGLIIQWGTSADINRWTSDSGLNNMSVPETVNFSIEFPSKCLSISITPHCVGITDNHRAFIAQVDTVSKNDFVYRLYGIGTDFHSPDFRGTFHVDYIAIGK